MTDRKMCKITLKAHTVTHTYTHYLKWLCNDAANKNSSSGLGSLFIDMFQTKGIWDQLEDVVQLKIDV